MFATLRNAVSAPRLYAAAAAAAAASTTCMAGGYTLSGRTASMESAAPASTAAAEDVVVEGVTGIPFPSRIKTPLGSFGNSDEVLVGTAVRCMMGMCQWQRARAYAVGLYVQEPLANKFAASEEKQAAGTDNGSSARALLMGGAGAGSRRLVLIMNQDVGGKHIAHGFDKSLIPRQGNRRGEVKNALKAFTKPFNSRAMLKKGEKVEFLVSETLVVTLIEGQLVSAIECPALGKALLGVYLDDKSIFAKYKNTSFSFV